MRFCIVCESESDYIIGGEGSGGLWEDSEVGRGGRVRETKMRVFRSSGSAKLGQASGSSLDRWQ